VHSRPRLAAVAVLLSLTAACTGQTTTTQAVGPTVLATGTGMPTPTPTLTVSATATGTPTPTPTPTPTFPPIATPNATVAPPEPLEAVRGTLLFEGGKGTAATLFVVVHNPNAVWGIVRGTFEVTAVDSAGQVVAVFGQDGVPGAACCTIYQLPPLGTYWVSGDATAAIAKVIKSIEIRVVTGWTEWSQAVTARADVTVSGTRLRVDDGGNAHVTGRIKINDPNGRKYNVAVFAVLNGGNGSIFASTVVDCVEASTGAAFEAVARLGGLTKAKLGDVIGMTTTIPGVGAIDSPPGC
jgi:hypothetical protein